MKTTLAAILLALLVTACASDPKQASTEPREEKEYVTGSNLPRRDRRDPAVSNVDPAAIQDAISRSVRTKGGAP
jgi:PBP1b-binding outer membrane lipoprotein LpoB